MLDCRVKNESSCDCCVYDIKLDEKVYCEACYNELNEKIEQLEETIEQLENKIDDLESGDKND